MAELKEQQRLLKKQYEEEKRRTAQLMGEAGKKTREILQSVEVKRKVEKLDVGPILVAENPEE